MYEGRRQLGGILSIWNENSFFLVSSWYTRGVLVVNGMLKKDGQQDGTCKSKMNRFLVNEDWINKWPNYSTKSGGRTLSDHCPIYLDSSRQDWGPRPFKFINNWISHPDFKEFIKTRWNEYKVNDWAGFRLKEKLKLMKADLKEWNKSVSAS